MNLFQAYGRMWKKTFDFKSRATRREFWYVFLVNYIISFGLSVIRSIGSAMSGVFMNFNAADVEDHRHMGKVLRHQVKHPALVLGEVIGELGGHDLMDDDIHMERYTEGTQSEQTYY